LRWGNVYLEAVPPCLEVEALHAKNRKRTKLELVGELAAELRQVRPAVASDADLVFLACPSMDEHRELLEKAGIPYKDAMGRQADIHSLRKTFATMLNGAGVGPRVAQELMRHSDMRLTMKEYTDTNLLPLSAGLALLPSLLGKSARGV